MVPKSGISMTRNYKRLYIQLVEWEIQQASILNAYILHTHI